MRVFLSSAETEVKRFNLWKYPNILLSFFYVTKDNVVRFFEKFPYEGFEMILVDSGGYSARKTGRTINIKDYASYLNTYEFPFAVNLDVVNVEDTLKNFEYLRNKCPKTKILPVYHFSDYVTTHNKHLLKTFVSEGSDYIFLGGLAGMGVHPDLYCKFLSYCFAATDHKIKLHGLGITAETFLEKFPFYSVDSSTWVAPRRFNHGLSKLKYGNDFSYVYMRTTNSEQKLLEEANYFRNLGIKYTKLWKRRGITWTD